MEVERSWSSGGPELWCSGAPCYSKYSNSYKNEVHQRPLHIYMEIDRLYPCPLGPVGFHLMVLLPGYFMYRSSHLMVLLSGYFMFRSSHDPHVWIFHV